MVNKLILFIICLSILTSSCTRIDDCPTFFELPATLTPITEEYKLGDTITIISKFSKNVLEFKMNRTFNMEGVKWKPAIGVANLDSLTVDRNTMEFVDFLADQNFDCGVESNLNGDVNGIACEYIMVDDSFNLVVKLVPKKSGLYSIQFISSLIEENDQDFEGKCKLNFFEGRTRLNGDHDANIHLLENSPATEFNQMLDWDEDKQQIRFYEFGHYICRFVE